MRTERGPQQAWLRHVGKTEDPYCPCDGTTAQTGIHITFECPTHRAQRTRLLTGSSTWEELDTDRPIRVDINEYEDGVMLFFLYLFDHLT